MGQNIKGTSRKGTSALLGVGIVAKKVIQRYSVNNEPREIAEVCL